MSMGIRVLMTVGLIACLTSVSHAIAGQATFFGPPYVPTGCFGSMDVGNRTISVNSGLFGGGAACGLIYRVTCTGPTNPGPQPCTGNSVDALVVDRCPECNSVQIELSNVAFAKIANLNAMMINIEYTEVGPIDLHRNREFEDAKNKLVMKSISSLFT